MGATDIDGATKRLSSLLNPEPVQTEPTPNIEQPEPETANTEEMEQIEDASQDETSEPIDEPKYTVKVNGEEIEVTLDELQKGYMMQADYSRKTAEVSEKRKALEAKESQINEKLSEAEQLIQFELDELKSEDMLELKEYDPESYWKKVEKVNAKAEKFKVKKQEQQEKLLAKKQKLLAEEREKLLNAVPDWAVDADRMQTESKELAETLATFGFSDAEIGAMSDHRMILLAREALKLKQLQGQKPQNKLVKEPPKSIRPSTKPTKAQVQDSKTKEMRDRLRKSGGQKDAAALIRKMLGD
jgi:hypothetical protein